MNPKIKVMGAVTGVLGFLVVLILTVSKTNRPEPASWSGFLPGNPGMGGELFYEKGCADCHAISGVGGKEAPDLARSGGAPSDLLEIAGAMWNHAPTMWESMISRANSVPTLTPRDFIDLMAFLFTAGYLEEEGDPHRGQAVFSQKGCGDCHAIEETETEPKIGPDLVRWSSRVNPILWAQLLWEHAPAMEQAVRERGLSWPHISPPEVVDLFAFLRSVGTGPHSPAPLPGDPWAGRYLFRKNCHRCHRAEGEGGEVGPDLGAISAPRTLSDLAASFWNHVPAMEQRVKETGFVRSSFTEQEMSDLITYLFAIQYPETPGDPVAGADAYSRCCSPCHGKAGEGDVGPSLLLPGSRSSPSFIAASLWNHGPRMYEKVNELGLDWPLLQDDEMRHVIAYLSSLSSEL